MHYCWFQQDGAHTARATMSELRQFFDDRLISIGLWPPHSPDLNKCNFFLWGYLKDRVYPLEPHTLDNLKNNTMREINNIPVSMLQRVSNNCVRREIVLPENFNCVRCEIVLPENLSICAVSGHLSSVVRVFVLYLHP